MIKVGMAGYRDGINVVDWDKDKITSKFKARILVCQTDRFASSFLKKKLSDKYMYQTQSSKMNCVNLKAPVKVH